MKSPGNPRKPKDILVQSRDTQSQKINTQLNFGPGNITKIQQHMNNYSYPSAKQAGGIDSTYDKKLTNKDRKPGGSIQRQKKIGQPIKH